MNNYKEKYLKYKEKYLKLKKIQVGGVTPILYIYTTGIGYGMTPTGGDPQLANFWISDLRQKILDLIPRNINRIEFKHHDILVDCGYITQAQTGNIVTRLNTLLSLNDIQSDPRVQSSEFTNRPLDFAELTDPEHINNHLVIDFAHIFTYDLRIQKRVYYQGNPYDISSIYIGFLGENQVDRGYSNRKIIDMQLFDFNPGDPGDPDSYRVITWIDKLIRLGYEFYTNYPQSIFPQLISNFRISMIPRWRQAHGGSIAGFDEVFETVQNVNNFFDYLVFLIFIDMIGPTQINQRMSEIFNYLIR